MVVTRKHLRPSKDLQAGPHYPQAGHFKDVYSLQEHNLRFLDDRFLNQSSGFFRLSGSTRSSVPARVVCPFHTSEPSPVSPWRSRLQKLDASRVPFANRAQVEVQVMSWANKLCSDDDPNSFSSCGSKVALNSVYSADLRPLCQKCQLLRVSHADLVLCWWFTLKPLGLRLPSRPSAHWPCFSKSMYCCKTRWGNSCKTCAMWFETGKTWVDHRKRTE